mgnify:FL=1
MSDLALSGLPVLSGALFVPERGVWVADLVVDTETPPTERVQLTAGDDRWHGAVLRGGVSEGRWMGRVVGGRGRLSRVVPPRLYQRLQARPIVEAIMREAGEELAADAPGLTGYLQSWTRARGTAAALLSLVLGHLGLAWRALPDGTLTTAPWPTAAVDASAQELDTDPSTNTTAFAPEGLDLLPGLTSAGRTVRDVVYTLDGPALRAAVTWR